MKDEIKAILEESLDYEFNLTFKQRKDLLDYITNLQEENRQTKLLKERYQLEKEDYKSRNEKAIESLTKNKFYIDLDEVLNILKEGN